MKEENKSTGEILQPTKSEPQTPTSKNGVFMMRGKGQSIEEFARICVQSFIEAGLIKEETIPPKAGSAAPSNGQTLPDQKDRQ